MAPFAAFQLSAMLFAVRAPTARPAGGCRAGAVPTRNCGMLQALEVSPVVLLVAVTVPE